MIATEVVAAPSDPANRRPISECLLPMIAGRYQAERVIGRGGMGIVYEALHLYTRCRLAVKVIHPEIIATSRNAIPRFLREASAPAEIDHPGVVAVRDAGVTEEGVVYLVFDLVAGEDLETIFDGRGLGPEEIVDVAIDVLDVLEVAHAQGFVHRDVKPSNILIARGLAGRSRVKLLDFGIARHVGGRDRTALTAPGVVLGSFQYMSPEQALGMQVDPRTDVWGLGAVLFRGLVGHPPLQADTLVEMLQKLQAEDAPSLAELRPDLPEALTQAVNRALARDPSDRFSSAWDMRNALEAWRESRRASEPRLSTVHTEIHEEAPKDTAVSAILPKTSPRPPAPRALDRWRLGALFLLVQALEVGIGFGLHASSVQGDAGGPNLEERRALAPASSPAQAASPPAGVEGGLVRWEGARRAEDLPPKAEDLAPRVEGPPPKVEDLPPKVEDAPRRMTAGGADPLAAREARPAPTRRAADARPRAPGCVDCAQEPAAPAPRTARGGAAERAARPEGGPRAPRRRGHGPRRIGEQAPMKEYDQ